MRSEKVFLIFAFFLFPGSIYFSQAQGLEYEIGLGPQFTKALISDYSVGIIGDNKPHNNHYPIGYTFGLTVRNHAEHLQIGLQLLHDYTRFNVYLPVAWPPDYKVKKSSRWNNYYQALRFGLGGQIRYSFGKGFVETGLSYLSMISAKSKSIHYYAFSDSCEETEGEDYSKAGGLLAGASLGMHFCSKENHSFNISIGVQYSFYEQRYMYETFLQDWTVRPINFNMMFGYQFSKSAKE